MSEGHETNDEPGLFSDYWVFFEYLKQIIFKISVYWRDSLSHLVANGYT